MQQFCHAVYSASIWSPKRDPQGCGISLPLISSMGDMEYGFLPRAICCAFHSGIGRNVFPNPLLSNPTKWLRAPPPQGVPLATASAPHLGTLVFPLGTKRLRNPIAAEAFAASRLATHRLACVGLVSPPPQGMGWCSQRNYFRRAWGGGEVAPRCRTPSPLLILLEGPPRIPDPGGGGLSR